MPRHWLLTISTLTGSFDATSVDSSGELIWNPPSPTTGQHLAGAVEAVVQRHEHLVLADVGDDGGRATKHTAQRAHHLGRGRRLVGRGSLRIDEPAHFVVGGPLMQARPPFRPL